MASISFSEAKGWVGAAWVLRGIARRMQESGDFPSLKRDFEAVEAGVQYLDLRELGDAERAELRRVAPLILQQVRDAGPEALSDPAFYPSFLAAFEEFEQLARQEGDG